ncbi:expressed unknown protein [Seminavis robusta]|uniref:Uncharacterized protein n=1 Tax=Seminavis robusta TaxID=568900 RepID=A0A9N8HEE4_9STRA|nr:expressed unknown protein [Seminavis robusta]|eukprot:Sro511_g157460.1 n/a (919) ;mRNA; f:36963-39999
MQAFSSSNTANPTLESVVDNKNGSDSVGGHDDDWEDFVNERKLILEEAKQLQKLADFFAHPEKTVAVDGFAKGRNYFTRVAAPEVLDEDTQEECDDILKDVLALKKNANFFYHPEAKLEIDSTACARNYFSQPWATEQESFGQAEQRVQAIQLAQHMAKTASDYQHPEAPVGWKDAAVFGRNYFQRPSAEDTQDEQECELILQEMKQLKQLAVTFQHPEAPLQVDPTAFGRNYFSRASAPEQETDEYTDDREIILEEMKELKEAAVLYRHPEKPLEVDPTASARNYFTRASALEQETDEYTDDRDIILEEMRELKEAAMLYRHPEKPLEVDPTACARNYFDRASAEEQDDEAAERAAVLRDMKALKSLAVTYRHPELPVQVDATACARNYFTRASAPEQEDEEIDEEKQAILQDMALMKKQAGVYMHPEKPLEVDPTCFGRNYFGRASAVDQESFASAEHRALAIEEAAALKEQAVLYRHPEVPLETDATGFGRNYFARPSADDSDSEDEEERDLVLQELAQLKKLAVDYLHPERAVVCQDPCAFGRNYFGRASAPDQEDEDMDEERDAILEELAELKRSAVDFMHPERPLSVDPTCFGRNYFERASAVEQEDDDLADEREIIREEMAELKRSAVDYMHPERPLPAVDATAFGRNYFARPSSEAVEDMEEVQERARVLADAAALKKLAVDYAHPELPVTATDATVFGRNYFSRPGAPEGESLEEAEERARVMADAAALKKSASDFAHPEKPVEADATACARSYFSRASAPQQESVEEAEERAVILAEAMALKKLASDYLHPEAPVTTADPAACGRNYFSRASALGVSEHIYSEGFENPTERAVKQDEYGHFEMDEEIFYDMRQSIVLPMASEMNPTAPKIQSSKMSSEEEGQLSRSPSSVMLFMGSLEDDHPPLPSMG